MAFFDTIGLIILIWTSIALSNLINGLRKENKKNKIGKGITITAHILISIFLGSFLSSLIVGSYDGPIFGYIGIVAIFSEVIISYNLKKSYSKKQPSKSSLWLPIGLLLIIFGVFFFIGLFSSYGNSVPQCDYPEVFLGTLCCVQSSELPQYCQNEYDDLVSKLDYELRFGNFTEKSIIMNKVYGIRFQSPEGYSLISNTQRGGLDVPYTYVFYPIDSDGLYDFSEEITIDIVSIQPLLDVLNTTLEEVYDDPYEIKKAFLTNAEDSEISSGYIKTVKGYEAYQVTYNREENIDGTIKLYQRKSVILLNYPFILNFGSTEEYTEYQYEFEELVGSFEIIN